MLWDCWYVTLAREGSLDSLRSRQQRGNRRAGDLARLACRSEGCRWLDLNAEPASQPQDSPPPRPRVVMMYSCSNTSLVHFATVLLRTYASKFMRHVDVWLHVHVLCVVPWYG